MKKTLLILLAASLVLCSCNNGEPEPDNGGTTDPDVSATASTEFSSDGTTDGSSESVVTETVTQTVTDASGKPVTQSDGKPVTQVIVTEKSGTAGKTSGKTSGKTDGKTTKPTKKTTGKTATKTTKPTEAVKPTIQLGASDMELFQKVVDTENAWLASIQLDNGAIPMTPVTSGSATLNPYFSDFAALSMLNHADKYAANVKKYMDWHFDHLNTAKTDYNGVDGTIYDYTATVSNGKVTAESTKKTYDSTDSYAATFLMVVQKYVEKTGDKAYAVAHKSEIERIVNAMFATSHNGLTLAKPDYAIKYLMDNCEVYGGMVAAEKLYTDVLVPAGASKTTRDKLKNGAKTVANKIEQKMWTGSHYLPALGTDDKSAYAFSWGNYYPSATAQVFPVLFGLIDPGSDRAKSLYDTFCQNYDWENFNHPDTFYWGSNVQAAAMMGDVDSVRTYMSIYERVVMKTHRYPLYNADAAKVCMAAYEILQMAG